MLKSKKRNAIIKIQYEIRTNFDINNEERKGEKSRMKKEITVFLLAAGLMTSSLTACNQIPPNGDDINTTTTTTEQIENDSPAGGEEVGEKIYYKVEKIELTTVRYTIYDAKGNAVLTEQTDRPLEISMLGEKVVDICIGMGTGLSVHKYYNVEENCFSQEYTYVAAATENLVAYIDGSSLADRKLVVRNIFDAELFYREFVLDFSETMTNPLIEARFTNDEIGLDLAYYTEKTPVKVTETLPILSDYAENQKFYLVYWSNGDGTCSVSAKGDSIVEAVIPPVSPFGERVTALANMSFYACKNLKSVVLPSSIQFINGGLTFEGCDSLSSVVYQGTAEQWQAIKGADQLSFDFDILFALGEAITEEQAFEIAREHWKATVQSDPKSYTYSLSLDEAKNVFVIVLNKRSTLAQEPFTPIVDVIWIDCYTGEVRMPDETVLQTTVTEEQAIETARLFWSRFLEKSETEYIVVPVQNNRWDKSVHVIMLKHIVYLNGEPSHYSTVEEIWVDRVTGEVRYPSAAPSDPEEYGPWYYVPEITETGDFASYEGIIKLYRNAINEFERMRYEDEKDFSLPERLGITDKTEKEWLEILATSGYLLYSSGNYDWWAYETMHQKLVCGYAIKDLNGDGIDELVLLNNNHVIVAIFSMVDGKPILLGDYIPRRSCWIDGDGLLHVDGSGGADVFSSTVYRIAEGGGSLEMIIEYGADGHEWVGDVAVTNYYKIVSGETIAITEEEYQALREQYGKYHGLYAGATATKECSGLQFTSVFTEAEVARYAYDAVLKNIIQVRHKANAEWLYLKDCKSPYTQTRLYEMKEHLSYVYQDLDGDGIDELIIDCGDTMILRYYMGVVYLYDFTFRQMYDLSTDGTFSWNHTGEDFEYGATQLYFDENEIVTREVWRIVNDGEPDARYYLDGTQVTSEELQAYIDANPKTEVTFNPLTVAAEWVDWVHPNYGKG